MQDREVMHLPTTEETDTAETSDDMIQPWSGVRLRFSRALLADAAARLPLQKWLPIADPRSSPSLGRGATSAARVRHGSGRCDPVLPRKIDIEIHRSLGVQCAQVPFPQSFCGEPSQDNPRWH